MSKQKKSKKIIWSLWLQGWNNAPEISTKCVKSWEHYNPDWEVIKLDKESYKDYINLDDTLPGLKTNNISLSNIIRISLVKKYGGIWADTTTWCNKPLKDWLPSETFLFSNPSPVAMISDWFISGKKDCHVIDTWYNATIQWWKWRIRETDQFQQRYRWSHDLFKHCYDNDAKFREQWKRSLKINVNYTDPPRGKSAHYFTPYDKFFFSSISEEEIKRIDSKVDPVYKLTYKVKTNWKNPENRGIHPGNEKIITPYSKQSPINYLFNTI